MKVILLIVSFVVIVVSIFLIPRTHSAISPTAYYTGHVWLRNGLSDERLATTKGLMLYHILEPLMRLSKVNNNGPTIEESLLARHTVIDYLLSKHVQSGEISHVFEIAAGMSPRGLRFSNKYGSNITYVELDLPVMAEKKKHLIGASLTSFHRVDIVDAMLRDGQYSISNILKEAKPPKGVVIVTEGLVNYFDKDSLENMWNNIGGAIRKYSGTGAGFYLSDIHLDAETKSRSETIFKDILQIFVRGKVHLHYSTTATATSSLINAGFTTAAVRLPRQWVEADVSSSLLDTPGAQLVSIISASVE